MTLFIVIPDYNGWRYTRRCLEALQADSQADKHVVVVDHGTTAETRRGLEREYPGVIRLAASPSLWWTGAVNHGIRHAMEQGAEAVVLLNNDCYAEPDALRHLAELHRAEPGSVIAALQVSLETGNVMPPVSSCFLLGFPSLHMPGRLGYQPGKQGLIRVRLISGGRLVLIPGAIFSSIGLFDEANLPHYGADHDFYLRCRKKHIPLVVSTNARVRVDDTQTTSAAHPGRLSFKEFMETLTNRRSHRNLKDLTALFKKHYPIKGLHYLGVALNIARYFAVYVWRRSVYLLTRQGQS